MAACLPACQSAPLPVPLSPSSLPLLASLSVSPSACLPPSLIPPTLLHPISPSQHKLSCQDLPAMLVTSAVKRRDTPYWRAISPTGRIQVTRMGSDSPRHLGGWVAGNTASAMGLPCLPPDQHSRLPRLARAAPQRRDHDPGTGGTTLMGGRPDDGAGTPGRRKPGRGAPDGDGCGTRDCADAGPAPGGSCGEPAAAGRPRAGPRLVWQGGPGDGPTAGPARLGYRGHPSHACDSDAADTAAVERLARRRPHACKGR